MYILSGKDDEILDSAFIERFRKIRHQDAVLIIASYGDSRPAITIGKYANDSEADEAFGALFYALSDDKRYFIMPTSTLFSRERAVSDARTKRRGGS